MASSMKITVRQHGHIGYPSMASSMKIIVRQHGHLGYSSMASSMKILVPQHGHLEKLSMTSTKIHPRNCMYGNMVTLDKHPWHHP